MKLSITGFITPYSCIFRTVCAFVCFWNSSVFWQCSRLCWALPPLGRAFPVMSHGRLILTYSLAYEDSFGYCTFPHPSWSCLKATVYTLPTAGFITIFANSEWQTTCPGCVPCKNYPVSLDTHFYLKDSLKQFLIHWKANKNVFCTLLSTYDKRDQSHRTEDWLRFPYVTIKQNMPLPLCCLPLCFSWTCSLASKILF